MDTNRFDALTKALARPATRRAAVGHVAAGGATAALLAAVGLGRPRAAAQETATATAAEDVPFNGGFRAEIYQGPSTGLTLVGRLDLTMDEAGRLSGEFVPDAGEATPGAAAEETPTAAASVPVTGQLSGVAINLVFYLPEGKRIFGVGTLGEDPATGDWIAGGPLVGPEPGDSGDWDICLRCSYIGGKLVCTQITCPGGPTLNN
jgi:hypothetical protein